MPRRIGYACATSLPGSLQEQLGELEAAGCVRVYSDDAVAPLAEMKGLHACLGALQEGDVLVISRIERVASTLAELEEVLARIDDQGAELAIAHWHPAPRMAPGDLCEVVRRLIDFESATRSELIKSGLEAARAKGRVGGRRHRLKPDQVKALKEAMAQPGADALEVGKRFGLGKTAVYRYLKAPIPGGK